MSFLDKICALMKRYCMCIDKKWWVTTQQKVREIEFEGL